MQCVSMKKTTWFAKLLAILISLSSATVSASSTGSSAMETDSNGNLVAVWIEALSNGSCIKAATKGKSASSWTVPVIISDQTTNSFSPQLVVDATGNAVAVWTSGILVNGSLSRGLFGAQLSAGGSWGSIATISPPTVTVGDSFQLCIDDLGDVSVLWFAIDLNAGTFNYFSSSTTIGGNWSAPLQVSQMNSDVVAGSASTPENKE